MIRLYHVSKRYGDMPALNDVSLHVAKGEFCYVTGPSGAGKSTMLKLLYGAMRPSSGKLLVGGLDVGRMKRRDLPRLRRNMGIVFQTAHFVRSLTVGENLALARSLAGCPADDDVVKGLLEDLGLAHKLGARVDALSVGEQQRVSIARAVVHGPGLILADEPTSALDDQNTDAVLSLLRRQAERTGAALLIVTHDQRLKDRMSDRVELNPTA